MRCHSRSAIVDHSALSGPTPQPHSLRPLHARAEAVGCAEATPRRPATVARDFQRAWRLAVWHPNPGCRISGAMAVAMAGPSPMALASD
eukprot:scaffold89674_cov25-Tisochrysis_lutea.AAC.3